MKPHRSIRSIVSLAGLAALAFLVIVAGSESASANWNEQILDTSDDCVDENGNPTPGPDMTIVIYNNSSDHNIYPVVLAGAASDKDQWMQSCFRITDKELVDNPFPRLSQYRIYVNCCEPGQNGIPPNGMVEITLPFYSPLVQDIDPRNKEQAQFIDWWQGGGINLFESPASSSNPPANLLAFWNKDINEDRGVTPFSNPPTCSGPGCSLHFFVAPSSIPNAAPQQLIEYTLGAIPVDGERKPGEPHFLWVSNNVDYDISNVNNVYMPAAIEPFGNTLEGTCCPIGWIGSDSTLSEYEQAIASWLMSDLAKDWPLYVDTNSMTVPKATIPGKVPSALEIFLNVPAFDNTSVFDPAPSQSPPIQRMVSLWQSCQMGAPDEICTNVRSVTALMQANFLNYAKTYEQNRDRWEIDWKCKEPPAWIEDPTPPQQVMLSHIYGWTPFNESCKSGANLLEDTPGYVTPTDKGNDALYYREVKRQFDQLQYSIDVLNGDYGEFDPYVALIHGPDYLDARFTYAYSVDDALGNMQTDGTGLIIGVGGTANLPNLDHVTPEVLFTFGYESNYPEKNNKAIKKKITFPMYGRCVEAPDTETNPKFTTFVVPSGMDGEASSVVNCEVTLTDSEQRHYKFTLKGVPSSFPEKDESAKIWPDSKTLNMINKDFVDCSGLSGQVLTSWCKLIYVFKEVDTSNPHLPFRHHVIMPAPPDVDPMKSPRPTRQPLGRVQLLR
ncbi:MAG: hypothetical protein AAF495_14680 [Pseudomonadota bacterium]